jgi:heme/copper-type cytochrome/quinol oxidase subunit 1
MNLEFVYKHFSRTIFIIASLGIVAAILEWIGGFIGFSVTGDMYTAGRLLELSAALLVFVIAVLLRQIRDELRSGQTS